MKTAYKALTAAVLAGALAISVAAFADEHGEHGEHKERSEDHHRRGEGDDAMLAAVKDPLTLKECGACHIAFPPALLPAASWKAVMADLPNHFGEDASLPADKVAAISEYLTQNAGRSGLVAGAPVLRISEQGWWIREHRNEVPPARWAEVGSKANCKACHRKAEQGDFED